ncbi:response regulator [Leptolyngbya sp. FACHB-8]|uniref:response regulator n=1 Tax=unclassified Leptolyngbya TaxID=2650499 RepID=UPI001682E6D9|nr:response regulator [Leptolyngbya sp. FACHB-8]MBD1913451.1 response regulator [Leptolyngbya sp. FACHB-8]
MAKLSPCRLLVVDQYVDTSELFTFALETAGASVVTVSSATEALRALDESHFHGLLCEIVLPDMDGCELLRRLRTGTKKYWQYLPAIAITGFVTRTIQQEVLAAGYSAYMAKPVDLDQLIAAIATLIQPL